LHTDPEWPNASFADGKNECLKRDDAHVHLLALNVPANPAPLAFLQNVHSFLNRWCGQTLLRCSDARCLA
jgi:hypothetical protein